ncbi:MAG: hypothetical protein H6738_08615 [Alphaproteobacteria bacterium]|nr:hypothetical protein [Alphaproteobacteria bacterium]MCB9696823.1 hypothetical protein [Alphaproteobacteria bacterium]
MLPWLAIAAAHAQALQITVTDPLVTAVVLECADGVHKGVVKDGVASIDARPQSCTVNLVRKSGTIDNPGRWTCTLDRCTQQEVAHQAVADAPGRVNVITTTELPRGSSFELTCATYRERAAITLNTAVFEGVPEQEDCTLFFKGSVPARFHPISPGTWSCGLTGNVAVCTQR